MGDVIQLDEHRAHCTLDCRPYGGDVEVIPLAYFIELAEGKIGELPPMLRKVVAEWLFCVRAGVIAEAQALCEADDGGAS